MLEELDVSVLRRRYLTLADALAQDRELLFVGNPYKSPNRYGHERHRLPPYLAALG